MSDIQSGIEDSIGRILVAGGGYVGAPLALRLAGDGRDVWGLRRTPMQGAGGLRWIPADVTQPETLVAIPADLDAVVYCVARGPRPAAQGYRDVFVVGQRNLLRVVRKTSPGLRRWLFVSSTGVYGQEDGAWVDEDSPTEPVSESGRCLLEAEAVAREAPGDSVVVRLSGIYGPGRSRLIRGLRDGTLRSPVDDGGWMNQIHRDDCVGALRHVLLMSDPRAVYLACDEEPASRADVVCWLAARMGVRLDRADPGDAWIGRSLARGNKRVNSRRLRESGYVFQYPTYREGYAQVLACGEGA